MFLADRDILELVKKGVIKNVALPEDPFDRNSPVQPCSIDLKVGQVLIPGVAPDEPGGADNPKREQHVLMPGETALVTALEEFALPPDIAGFGFPPARMSRNGILMTNPGHIDPGYTGHVSFTLVNMGHEPYALVPGEDICTILLFRLTPAPQRDYPSRGPYPPADMKSLLSRLSRDFLDVKDRAQKVAGDAVKSAELRLKSWQVWVPLAVAVLTLLAGFIPLLVGHNNLKDEVSRLQTELAKQVAAVQDGFRMEKRVANSENEISQMKKALEDLQKQKGP